MPAELDRSRLNFQRSSARRTKVVVIWGSSFFSADNPSGPANASEDCGDPGVRTATSPQAASAAARTAGRMDRGESLIVDIM